MYTPRAIDKIVEEQVRKWEATRRMRLVSDRPTPPSIITVSREAGARGHLLARQVAAMLDFRCWDQELLGAMAESGTASATLLAAIDEQARNTVAERIAVFGTRGAPVDAYMHELVKLVNTIAEQGRAVVVGRGAQYILGSERSVNVRAIAPIEDRIAGRMGRDGLEWGEAKRQIDRIDGDRRAFYRQHFDRTGTEVDSYDVVVNTATLGVEGAAEAVVAAFLAKVERIRRSSSATRANVAGGA